MKKLLFMTAILVIMNIYLLQAQNVPWEHFMSGLNYINYWEVIGKDTAKTINSNLSALEKEHNIRFIITLADPVQSNNDTNALIQESVRRFLSDNQKGWMVFTVFLISSNKSSDIFLYLTKNNLLTEAQKSSIQKMGFNKEISNNLENIISNTVLQTKIYLEKDNHLTPVDKILKAFLRNFLSLFKTLVLPIIIGISIISFILILLVIFKGIKIHPVFLIALGLIILLHIVKIIPSFFAIICYIIISVTIFNTTFGRKL